MENQLQHSQTSLGTLTVTNTQVQLAECMVALGYESASITQLNLMVQDALVAFEGYTDEEFRQLLKEGRQGKYGAIYGRINVPLIVEWERKRKSKVFPGMS